MGNIVFWLSILSILLHTPWELIQANSLTTCRGKPWYIKFRNCFVGIIFDWLYTLGVYYLFSYIRNDEKWLFNAAIGDYVIIFGMSLLIAYVIEGLALKFGFWQFHEDVARLPRKLGRIAVSPVMQLPLLVSISFFITQLILG